MRYILIDRITCLEPGRTIIAVKNVTARESLVTEYGSDLWALPPSMLLEAMAQAAGLLVASTIQFRAQPVLAKVQPFSADGFAVPGDQITLRAELRELRDAGCQLDATAHVGSTRLAEATIFLALVPLDAFGRAEELRARMARTFPGWFVEPAAVEVLP